MVSLCVAFAIIGMLPLYEKYVHFFSEMTGSEMLVVHFLNSCSPGYVFPTVFLHTQPSFFSFVGFCRRMDL